MGNCTDLVSRAEFEAFKASLDGKYIPEAEKAGIVNNAVNLSGQVVQGALAIQGGRVTQALNASIAAQNKGEALLAATRASATAAQKATTVALAASREALIAKGSGIAAEQIAKKASYEALYASSRASSAASAGGLAAKALGLLGTVFSILGTVASLVMIAILTAQVIALRSRVTTNEEETAKNTARIKANEEITAENSRQIVENSKRIKLNEDYTAKVENGVRLLYAELETTNAAIAKINSRIGGVNTEAKELINQQNVQIAALKTELALIINKLPEPKLIDDNSVEISKLTNSVGLLQRKYEQLTSDLSAYRVALNTIYAKIESIRTELSEDFEAGDIKTIKEVLEKIKNIIKSQSSGGGVTGETVKQIAKTEVDKQLTDLKQVNDKQATEIKTKLDKVDSKIDLMPTPTQIALAVGGLEIIRQISSNSAKAGGKLNCQAPALVPPVGVQAKRNGGAILGLQGVTIVQNGFTQKAVKAVSETTTKIDKIFTHKDYGLQKIQKFADTAWKATHADKVLNALSTAMVIHNGIMLSKNLAQTMGEAATVTLQAMRVTDSEGKPFDVGSALSGKLKQLITSAIGAGGYEALTIRIANYSRIYQSAANLTNTAFSLFDSARNIAETTAANTGKIGNALRESGAVYEDAYTEMLEKVNPQNAAMRRLEGFSNGLEAIEQGVSSISSVSSEVISIKDNYTQLKEEKETLAQETTEILAAKKIEKGEAKVAVQVSAEVKAIDFTKDET
jgi:hypothetical protein